MYDKTDILSRQLALNRRKVGDYVKPVGHKEKAKIIEIKTNPLECHWTHKGRVPQFIVIQFSDGRVVLCSPNQLRKR